MFLLTIHIFEINIFSIEKPDSHNDFHQNTHIDRQNICIQKKITKIGLLKKSYEKQLHRLVVCHTKILDANNMA